MRDSDFSSGYPQEFLRPEGLLVSVQEVAGLTRARIIPDGSFVFPNAPLESLRRQFGFTWADYDTLSGQKMSRPSSRELEQISFSTLFTLDDLEIEGLVSRRSPLASVALLKRIAYLAGPVRVVALGTALGGIADTEFDMLATLRSVESEERAGEPDARYVSVSFVEYRSVSYTERKTGGKGGPGSRLPVTVKISSLKGFEKSLALIAKAAYGSAAKWRVIRQQNPWMAGAGVTANTDLRTLSPKVLKAHPTFQVPRLNAAGAVMKPPSAGSRGGEAQVLGGSRA